MNREGHENAQFFYGKEVEHTPAYGKYTMFVVGIHAPDVIASHLSSGKEPVEHIYFGANQSFPANTGINDLDLWQPWDRMIRYFLDRDYLCTFDFDVRCAEGLLESGLTEHHNFIPMISVKLPYVNQFGYNATVKIDDKDFKATNPGVWCHSLHDLMNRDQFTDWSKYSKDDIL
jgi:hypothetical protein